MLDARREGGGGVIEPAILKFATHWRLVPVADEATQQPVQFDSVNCMATMIKSDIIFEAPMTKFDCALVLFTSGQFIFEALINDQAVKIRLYSADTAESAGMAKCVAQIA
jgi:hypothetical protein